MARTSEIHALWRHPEKLLATGDQIWRAIDTDNQSFALSLFARQRWQFLLRTPGIKLFPARRSTLNEICRENKTRAIFRILSKSSKRQGKLKNSSYFYIIPITYQKDEEINSKREISNNGNAYVSRLFNLIIGDSTGSREMDQDI